MATANLPKGRIQQLITIRARQKLIWSLPGYSAFWAFIFLIPWEAWMEENGAAPLAINAWRKLANFGDAPLPWFSVSLTVILILMAVVTFVNGLRELSNPAKHQIVKYLEDRGHDSVSAITTYERGMAGEDSLDAGAISATPEWVFIAGDDARLMSLSDLRWMHYKSDAGQDAVVGLFRAAGLVSRRQAELAANDTDVIVLYFEGANDPVEAESSTIFADEIITYFSAHNSEAIFGWDKSIAKLWESDRENFTSKARDRVQAIIQQQHTPLGDGSDHTASDAFEVGKNLIDKFGD